MPSLRRPTQIALSAPVPALATGELYKAFREEFVPVLADLYTAMMAVAGTPEGFVEGVITTLYRWAGETFPQPTSDLRCSGTGVSRHLSGRGSPGGAPPGLYR
jgi:hypothetical protein